MSPLVIEGEGQTFEFQVELADEPEEIRRGLMDRAEMDEDVGMIFDFGTPREANMWMKNTLIPLDMLFFVEDGTIVAIARNAVPGSLRNINPGMPVKGVLELNGGRAEALGIEPGDMLRHDVLENLGE